MPLRWRAVTISSRPEITWKMRSALSRWGMKVTCCESMMEAREIIKREVPQLVFCDDTLTDGTYTDLMGWSVNSDPARSMRVVIVPSTKTVIDADFISRALKQGAYAVLPRVVPEGEDIDSVVIQAIREETDKGLSRIAA